jgi:hypothetical protein
MHGIGKGRKPGTRNKTRVERIIDAVVTAAGGTPETTVDILEEHYKAEQNRAKTDRGAVRREFLDGNELLHRYLKNAGLTGASAENIMQSLLDYASNVSTIGSENFKRN